MVNFVDAVSKISVARNSKITEEFGQVLGNALKPAIDNGVKITKPRVRFPKKFAKVLPDTLAGTGRVSFSEAMSDVQGRTQVNIQNFIDSAVKEAKAKGKPKLDISEIAKYMEQQGMTHQGAQARANLLTGLDKLKATGAVDVYLSKGAINIDKADPALLARVNKIL